MCLAPNVSFSYIVYSILGIYNLVNLHYFDRCPSSIYIINFVTFYLHFYILIKYLYDIFPSFNFIMYIYILYIWGFLCGATTPGKWLVTSVHTNVH